MPKIVHLSLRMFDPEIDLGMLAETAARRELMLIGTGHLMAGGRLTILRAALAPRRMVALLIDDDLPSAERAVIADLLNDGVIPVLVAGGDSPRASLTSWLKYHAPSAGSSGRSHGRRSTGPADRPCPRRRARPRDRADGLRPAA